MAIHLTVVDTLLGSGSGTCFHFDASASTPSAFKDGEAHSYIRANEDRWLSQLDRWHIELSRKASSASPTWWLMPASRIVSWYPAVTEKLFFAMAVIDIVEKSKIDSAYLVKCPPEAIEFLRELRPNWIFEDKREIGHQQSLPKQISFKRLNKLAGWLWRTTRNTFRVWSGKLTPELVAYSHAMSGKNMRGAGDHFFARSLKGLTANDNKPARLLWFYLFATNDGASKKEILKIVNAAGDDAVFVDDLIGWRQAFSVLRLLRGASKAAGRIRAQVTPPKIDEHISSLFLAKWLDPQFTHYKPFNEAMLFVATQRLIKTFHPNALIYPYEEKGLEHALLLAVKSSGEKVRTIGFAHAVHNKGHMYMRNRENVVAGHPLPDVIGTTGPIVRDWLMTWGNHPPSRLAIAGSPRYTESLPPPTLDHAPRRVLAIISSAHELPALAALAEAKSDLFDGWELIVRRYPYGWYEEQDAGIARLKACGISLKVEGGPLKEQVSRMHAVIFCSSSAGFEAMLSARLTVYLNLNEIMELDPLTGKGDSSPVFKAQNPSQLKTALDRIRTLSNEEYSRLSLLQRRYAEGIYASPTFSTLVYPDANKSAHVHTPKSARAEGASSGY